MDPQAQLLAIAFDSKTVLVSGAIYLLLRMARSTPLSRSSIYWRLLPLLPDALGVAAGLLGGLPVVAHDPIIVRVAAGLWCGFLSQRMHKILAQSILGDDPDIESALVRKKMPELLTHENPEKVEDLPPPNGGL